MSSTMPGCAGAVLPVAHRAVIALRLVVQQVEDAQPQRPQIIGMYAERHLLRVAARDRLEKLERRVLLGVADARGVAGGERHPARRPEREPQGPRPHTPCPHPSRPHTPYPKHLSHEPSDRPPQLKVSQPPTLGCGVPCGPKDPGRPHKMTSFTESRRH